MKTISSFVFFALLGCGGLQKLAIRGSTPVFEKSSYDFFKESNWEFFRQSAPSNLKMMELLWEQDKSNLPLLSLLIRSFAGYSFAVSETLALKDDLAGQEDSVSKQEAIHFYTRALDYGVYYLESKKISREDLLANDETKILKKLKTLSDSDLPAILYFAQSWGSLINLQKENVVLISQIPKVKLLFDHVCARRPDIDNNVCGIFYAQYEASRPKMLGGDPKKAEELYKESILKNPKNLLIRMSYIQYLLIPSGAKKKYEAEVDGLRGEIAKWDNSSREDLTKKSEFAGFPELNLYNAITKKRLEIVESLKDKIF